MNGRPPQQLQQVPGHKDYVTHNAPAGGLPALQKQYFITALNLSVQHLHGDEINGSEINSGCWFVFLNFLHDKNGDKNHHDPLVLSLQSFQSDGRLLAANSLPQNLLKLNK